jgi:hypothetical protein
MAERQLMHVIMCEPTARVPPENLQTVQLQIEETAPDAGADGPGECPLELAARERA